MLEVLSMEEKRDVTIKFWILKENGGTNKFINQDIVQTTNFENMLQEYVKIHTKYKSLKKKQIKEMKLINSLN